MTSCHCVWLHFGICHPPLLQTETGPIHWSINRSVVPSSAVCRVRDMFLAKTVVEIETQSDSTTAVGQSRGADGDDFVFHMENEIANPDTNSTDMECLQYLEDKTYSLEALHKFPLSSTTLPFLRPAPVERRFSYAGMVLTKNAVAWRMKILNSNCRWKPTGTFVLTWTEITGTRTALKMFPLHCYTAYHILCTWTAVTWRWLIVDVMLISICTDRVELLWCDDD